jgi:hypothetical protein
MFTKPRMLAVYLNKEQKSEMPQGYEYTPPPVTS